MHDSRSPSALALLLVGSAAFSLSVFAIVAALHNLHVPFRPNNSGIVSFVTTHQYSKPQEQVYYIVSLLIVALCCIACYLDWRKVAALLTQTGRVSPRVSTELAAVTLLPAPVFLLSKMGNGQFLLSAGNIVTCAVLLAVIQGLTVSIVHLRADRV